MNLERLDSSEAIRPFLFRVVRNLSYGELKRQGRFQPVPINEVLDESSTRQEFLRDHRPLPDEKLHWVLLYSEVRSAMKYLPELQRQTLILYSLENLTYTQIAEVMATDIGTVKSRIYYARQNLRKWLKPEILSALGIEKETKNGRNS